MKQHIFTMLMLLGALASCETQPATAATRACAVGNVCASGRLLNVTQPQPYLALYTPTVAGLYRTSVVVVLVESDADSTGAWMATVTTFDAGGSEQWSASIDAANRYPTATVDGEHVRYQAAQTPITMALDHSTTDLSIVEVYWVVERVQ